MTQARPSNRTPQVPAATLQAWIDEGRLEQAQEAIAQRLRADAKDAEALFFRGVCAMLHGQSDAAQADFETAQHLKPKDVRFTNALAALALIQGHHLQALEHARKALKAKPTNVPALHNQATALLRLERWPEALEAAQALVEQDRDSLGSRRTMGAALRGVGRMAEALTWFEAAQTLLPDSPALRLDIALCVFHMGDRAAAQSMVAPLLEADDATAQGLADLGIQAQGAFAPVMALAFFKQGHARFPTDLTLLVNLGITVQAFGNPGEALYYLQQATVLNGKCETAWYHAALSHQALRDKAAMEECLKQCIAADPRHAKALATLAGLRKDQGKPDEARQLLRDAIEGDPHWEQAYLNLAAYLQEAGEFDEAASVLDEAQAHDVPNVVLRHHRASLLLKRGDIAGANALFREILRSEPENSDAMSGVLFCSNYDPELTPEQISEAYKSWDRRFIQWRAPPADYRFANKPLSRRRVKLGYVSGDFRQHSVAFFSEPLLAHHDHEQFEIYCYANQKGGDPITQRMMGMADHWRWTLDLSDEALVEMIRLDGIDILIDLSNHTAFHRLYMFGRKAAPIQMTTLGMPTTTGLSAIDWRITDAFMDPPGLTEHLHSEKLLRIVSGWCYKTSHEAEDLPVSELPALKNGYITFASFNAFGKINPKVFKLWGQLLKVIPDAELLLATGGKEDDKVLNDRIKKTCRACGVPWKRVRLMPRKPFKEYFLAHNEVDIVLDAFPYTGATVTAHALWMGVPVITLSGPSPIHRSATSMMSTVGHPEFVAQTQDEYIEIAQRWAADIPALAALRAGLRAQVQASPLMDGATVTRDLEKKLRQVWRDWSRTQKATRSPKADQKQPQTLKHTKETHDE